MAQVDPPEEPRRHPGQRDPDNPRFYDPDWKAWESPRRWPMVIATVLLLVGVVGGYLVLHHRDALPSHPHFNFPAVKTGGNPIPGSGPGQPAAIVFRGKSTQKNLPLTVQGGVQVFTMSCRCSAYFAVEVATKAGVPVALPVNTNRAYTGSVAVSIPTGSYDLTVVADLPWKVSITQPTGERPWAPKSYVDAFDGVLGPFQLTPTSHLKVAFLPFVSNQLSLALLPAAGGTSVPVLSSSAQLLGTTVQTKVPTAGLYYVTAQTGGFWSVKVLP